MNDASAACSIASCFNGRRPGTLLLQRARAGGGRTCCSACSAHGARAVHAAVLRAACAYEKDCCYAIALGVQVPARLLPGPYLEVGGQKVLMPANAGQWQLGGGGVARAAPWASGAVVLLDPSVSPAGELSKRESVFSTCVFHNP